VSTIFSIVLQASIAATGASTYPTAYQQATETGRPLVVLVGADWCPACVQMKNNVIPQLEKQGGLEKVNFCCINTDQQNDLAKKLMRGGSIPQLIMFRRTRNGGWLRKQLNGAQSITETQSFVSVPAETMPTVTAPSRTAPTVPGPAVTGPAVAKPTVKTPTVTKPTVNAPTVTRPAIGATQSTNNKLTHRSTATAGG